jgi:hypothetical protein
MSSEQENADVLSMSEPQRACTEASGPHLKAHYEVPARTLEAMFSLQNILAKAPETRKVSEALGTLLRTVECILETE